MPAAPQTTCDGPTQVDLDWMPSVVGLSGGGCLSGAGVVDGAPKPALVLSRSSDRKSMLAWFLVPLLIILIIVAVLWWLSPSLNPLRYDIY
jgi:hypothetical protein